MQLPLLDGHPAQPVIRRLNSLRQLSPRGISLLQQVILDGLQRARPGEDIATEGDQIDSVRIVLSGWLCRYKTLEDGRRQIVNFVLPGDTCEACVYLLSVLDHSIGALAPVVYADIKRGAFEDLLARDRSLEEALWCETMVNGAIQREWTLNVGRRDALERVAHLLCELYERLLSVGMIDDGSCAFPVTQTDLADATGLSVVHVNRTLQELRGTGLIVLRDRTLTITDLKVLQNTAMFSAEYLRTKRRG